MYDMSCIVRADRCRYIRTALGVGGLIFDMTLMTVVLRWV